MRMRLTFESYVFIFSVCLSVVFVTFYLHFVHASRKVTLLEKT